MHRMCPHQPLQHRLEHRLLFVGIIEEAERAAGIHQRMLADHVLDLGLGVVVERVIGRAHVGEFGVAALGIDHPRRQQRKFGRDRAERTVGMPQAVAEIEKMGTAVARQRLAVLAEVGNVVQPRRQAVVFLLGDGAAARALALAEIQSKGQLLFVRDVLVAKQQHGVFVHARFNIGRFLRSQGLAQINARNLAEEMRMKLPDRDRHGVSPVCGGRFVPLHLQEKLLPDMPKSTPRTHARYAFRAINPPSTGITAPVRNEAAGRHRLSVMCATSSGSP